MRKWLVLGLLLCWKPLFSQFAQFRYTIRPYSEGNHLAGAVRSRLEGTARLILPRGMATYRFRVLSGMQVRLLVTARGKGQLRISSQGIEVGFHLLKRGVGTHTLSFRTPTTFPIQTLLVTFQTKRGQRIYFYGLSLQAEDRDLDGDGIGDAVERLLGVPASHLKAVQPPFLRTTFQTGSGYDPRFDLQTDAVLVYSDDPARIRSWKERGYFVQVMGGFRDSATYASAHPEAVQTNREGQPFQLNGSFYLTPTEERLHLLKGYYRRALESGAQAICPEQPEYWADAGYEEAFKRLWQARYGEPWQPPHESVIARWKADRFKATLMREMVHALLEEAQHRQPNARRMIAVHSPINYALWRLCFAHAQTLLHPLVQEVIGQVWSDTVRTEVAHGGWKEEPFALAYLEYASLIGLLRGTDKTLWLLMDPLADNPHWGFELYKRLYATTVIAAALFQEVRQFEVLPWPERIFGRVPSEYATLILNVIRALESIAEQKTYALDAGSPGLGALIADSMAFQRGAPHPSRMEDLWGFTLPFIKRGLPLQLLTLDRVREPSYLRSIKLLMLSYDFFKPEEESLQDALANWVHQGGWLLIFGGAGASNELPEAWWKQKGFQSPTESLLNRVGMQVQVEHRPPRASLDPGWRMLGTHGADHQHGLSNRRWVRFDLSEYAGQTVFVRFSDPLPEDGWGPLVRQIRLEADGRLLAAFYTGTALESLFLYDDHGSQRNQEGRYADSERWFVYRFPLPQASRAELRVEIAQEWQVSVSLVPPYEERLIQPMRSDLPALRLRDDEPITLYRSPAAETLYTWQGEPVGILQKVGRGGVVALGVPARAFALYPRGPEQVRTLIRHLFGRIGLRYRERACFVARRGNWVIAWGTYRPTTLRGVFLDILEPNLPLVRDPVLMPETPRLLLQVGTGLRCLGLLHTSARIVLRSETPNRCAYLLKGPAGTPGVLRMSTGGRPAQVEAYTPNGEPVPVKVERNGSTLLARWEMEPNGTVLIVR